MKNGRIFGKVFAFAVLFATLAFVSIGCASAATHYVDPGESIQAAVNVANSGDTIIVRDGIYTENINVYKRLIIFSENGAASTIVQAAILDDHVFEITVDYVNISGFTVENATGIETAGILLESGADRCNIFNNTVSNNYVGIGLFSSSNNTITGNTFVNDGLIAFDSYQNTVKDNAVNGKPLVYLENQSGQTITNAGQVILVNCDNITVENQDLSEATFGLELWRTENSTIANNNASNNEVSIALLYSSNNTITNNNANSNNEGGIFLGESCNNIIANNDLSSNNGGGIVLEESHNNIIANNTANSNNGTGMIISLSNYNTLSDNVVTSNTGDGIFIGEGSEGNNITTNDVLSNIDCGISLNNVSCNNIVSNNISDNQGGLNLYESCNNIVTNNTANLNNNSGINLDNSNNNTITNNTANENDDHGISLHSSNSNTITNNTANLNKEGGTFLQDSSNYNTLTGNTASNNRYGIYIDSSSNNTITGNTANSNTKHHGIWLWESCDNTITNNTANFNNEGGICLDYSDDNTITNNTANENNHSGIQLFQKSCNNTVTDNTANLNNESGIGVQDSSNYNAITDNTASFNNCGGIFLADGSQNNWIINNTASNNNEGIFLVDSSNNILSNNIASNNYEEGIVMEESSNYNSITDNTANLNNARGISLVDSSNNILTNNTVNSNTENGISLSSSCNNNLSGNNAYNNSRHGIRLSSSTYNTLTNNTVNSNTEDGISLSSSCNNNLSGNNAYNNSCHGIRLSSSSYYNNLSGNNAYNNSRHGIRLSSSSNNNLSGNNAYNNSYDGIYLVSSSSSTLTNNTVDSNNNGIYAGSSNNNLITGNAAGGNSNRGILLDHTSDTTVSENNASYNGRGGILLGEGSRNNLIINNIASNNSEFGIDLSHISTDNNQIYNNTANGNDFGINLNYSNSNTIVGNTLNENSKSGIRLDESHDNLIYNNYFNNTNNAEDNRNNIWNITEKPGTNIIGGPYLGGNYWSDYTGIDTDGDRLGDTLLPYNSSGDIQNGGDWHPLVFKHAKTIYVPDDYPTIQAAVNNATAGDTIIVKDGTYTENVNVNVNHLTIQSENGSASTIVQAAIPDDHVFEIMANHVNLSGFTIENAAVEDYAVSGIYLAGVEHCNISDNICNNNTIGTYLNSTHNSVMDNNFISNCGVGIVLVNSNLNTVTNNEVSNANWGISLWQSNFNSVITNTIFNTTTIEIQYGPLDAIGVGIEIMASSNNLVDNNTILNTTALQTNARAFSIFVVSYGGRPADNNTIANNEIYHTTGPGEAGVGVGICVMANNNKLFNNNASFNEIGIVLQDSSYTRIEGNYVGANQVGMFILFSDNNIFANNTASNNAGQGIRIYASNNNTVINNTVNSNNGVGISLGESNSNRIIDNIANENSAGIELEGSSNNLIYNNRFDNTNNAYDDGNNIWNISKTEGTNIIGGHYLGGNYWSDYAGTDTDGDGLGDTPYDIPGGTNKDYLPLVKPVLPTFDTGPGTYLSIMGTHEGKIIPSCDINVSRLYTYPCAGTGGHTESIELYNENETLIASGVWNGYQGDYHNLTVTPLVTLREGHEYRYVIKTGSYPQIIHEPSREVTGGTITCTQFTDANGKTYTDWIPAIMLEVEEKEIKIGIVAPLTGGASTTGQDMWQAAALAAEEINTQGGVNVNGVNMKITLVKGDTETSREGGVEAVTKLITEDKVDILVGGFSSGITYADQVVASEHKVPFIITGASSPAVTRRTDIDTSYFFHHCPTTNDHPEATLLFVNDVVKPRVYERFNFPDDRPLRLGVLYQDSKYGEEIYNGINKTIENHNLNMEIVAAEKFWMGETDFRTPLMVIKASNPDVVYPAAFLNEQTLIVTQGRRDVGLNTIYLSVECNDDYGYYTGVERWGEYSIQESRFSPYAIPSGPIHSAVVKFKEDFESKWGASPTMMAASSYEGVYIAAEAAKNVGTLDKEKIRDSLAEIEIPQIVELMQDSVITFSQDYRESKFELYMQQLIWNETAGETRPKIVCPESVKETDFVLPDWYDPGST